MNIRREQGHSGERTRLACWSRRPAETDFYPRGVLEERLPFADVCLSSLQRDAAISTRDACAPQILRPRLLCYQV